jgi:hypothetical protein
VEENETVLDDTAHKHGLEVVCVFSFLTFVFWKMGRDLNLFESK